MFSDLKSDAVTLLRQGGQEMRRRPGLFFVALPAVALAAAVFFFPRDVALADWCYRDRLELLRQVARRFSAYMDFRLPLILFVALLGLSIRHRRPEWRQLGVAILLAASLAGFVATAGRTLTGRPRPSAFEPDRFRGPTFLNHKDQSFPSAHSATSMATAGVLVVAVPSVGVPFLVLSCGVPWSRFYMHDHYLSDITVGSCIGLWFGLAGGWAWRRKRME